MNDVITNQECYGCMLCVSKCPSDAIVLKKDECGFIYPIIEIAKCIVCNQCRNACIANFPPQYAKPLDEAYSAFLHSKDDILKSASGGAAYGLALAQLSEGGVVYGVAYTDDFRSARYTRVKSKDELQKLQDTKYFHAEAATKIELLRSVENDLKCGISVLVVGLPCEIAALRKTFGDEPLLILVELFCHGVTTVETHTRYLHSLIKSRRVTFFSVKSKIEGWKKNAIIRLIAEGGKTFQVPFYSSEYGYAFSHLSRKSCYECHFKGANRVGDLSIGDYWGGLKQDQKYNRNGVSVVQVHSARGKNLLEKSEEFLELTTIGSNEAIIDNEWVDSSIPIRDRENYAKRFAKGRGIYVPIKTQIRRKIKTILGKR